MIAQLRRWWVGLCLTLVLAGLVGGLWVGGGWRGFGAGALGALLAYAGYLAFFALTSPLGALSRLFVGIAGLDAASGMALLPVALALLIAFLLGGAGGWLGGALLPPSRSEP